MLGPKLTVILAAILAAIAAIIGIKEDFRD